jgi:hypothetical protein
LSDRCAFRLHNGKFCRRWPIKGTPYCLGHTPRPQAAETEDVDENLSPLDRLTTHDDLFDVVRESLNAIRTGRLSPGRAYATGYFIDLWMRVRERMEKAGPDTKTFQKRRRLSNPIEQAMFDVVSEKVIQVITGKTSEEIERNGGTLEAPGEPPWVTQRVHTPITDVLFGEHASNPNPQIDYAHTSPTPKNWGQEKEKQEETKK